MKKQPNIKKETKSVQNTLGEKRFWFGAQATSFSLMETGTTFGFGLNGLYSATGKRQAFFVDCNYYYPCHSQRKKDLYYVGTSPDQFQLKINVNYKISAKSGVAGYRMYFFNNILDEGFKVYMQAFAGMQTVIVSSTSESYNKQDYLPHYQTAYSATELIAGWGFGGEYSINSKLNIFGDMNLNFPVKNIGIIKVDAEVPVAVRFNLGTKYRF